LPTTSKTKAIETALDPAAKKTAMVVYAETHSRPDDHDQLPDHGRDDGLQGDPTVRDEGAEAAVPRSAASRSSSRASHSACARLRVSSCASSSMKLDHTIELELTEL